jgi:hypothetical protein
MKKKIALNFVFLSALIVVGVSSCKVDDNKDDGLDFEIALPAGWTFQVYNDPVIKYYAWSPERIQDDQAGVEDTINEDILVSKQAYADSDLDGFSTAIYLALVDEPGFYELSTVDTTINGVEAKKMTHLQTVRIPIRSTIITSDSTDLDIQPIKYLFYRNGYGYVVDCSSLLYTYGYYKTVFDDIMSSFRFKN